MRVLLGFLKLLFLITLILSISMPCSIEAKEKGAVKIGYPPPKITLSDLNGRTVTIPNDFKGKAVVIHFWAVWCNRCLEELSAL